MKIIRNLPVLPLPCKSRIIMTSLSSCWQIQLQTSFHPHPGPDLNPVDYEIWSLIQRMVYQSRIEDVRYYYCYCYYYYYYYYYSSVGTGPTHYWYCSQAVAHSPSILHVEAKGDHFEHKLPWLNDEMPDKPFNRSILRLVYYNFRISDQMRR